MVGGLELGVVEDSEDHLDEIGRDRARSGDIAIIVALRGNQRRSDGHERRDRMAIRWQSDENQMGMRGAINGQQSAYLVEPAQRVRDAIRAHQRASHLEE